MNDFIKRQRRIERLRAYLDQPMQTPNQVVALARRALDNPETMDPCEIQQIGLALVVHFAQMGIE